MIGHRFLVNRTLSHQVSSGHSDVGCMDLWLVELVETVQRERGRKHQALTRRSKDKSFNHSFGNILTKSRATNYYKIVN